MQQPAPFVLAGVVLVLLSASVYLFVSPNRELSLGDMAGVATSSAPYTLTPSNSTTETAEQQGGNVSDPATGTSTASTTPTEESSATTSPSTSAKPTVTLTQTGFTPNTLTVSAGTRVRFVNQSNNLMWVASDPYPTHSLYPEFDQKKAAGVGETFDFVFTKRGTWHYHNNTSPSQTGVIVVQ